MKYKDKFLTIEADAIPVFDTEAYTGPYSII